MEGTWHKVPQSRLDPGLFGHSTCEHKGSLYVFGGCDRNGNFYNNVYCWNLKDQTWTLLEVTGTPPCPRNFHSAVIVKNTIFVHGGKSNGYHADMYKFNITKKKWYSVSYRDKAPLARYGHALLFCNGSLYIVGGYDQHGFCCDDLYQFSPVHYTWRKIQFISPLGAVNIGRFHSAACVYKSKILIYAGKGSDSIKNDLLEYDLNNHTWKQLLATSKITPNNQGKGDSGNARNTAPIVEPPGRWGHTCTIVGDFIYVYGGRDSIVQFNDLYCFDLINLKWTLLLPSQQRGSLSGMTPEPRYFHSAVPVGNSIYFIWGKNIYDFNFDDIIEWRISSDAHPLNSSLANISSNSGKDSPRTIKDEIRLSAKSAGSDSSLSIATLGSLGAPSSSNRLSGERRLRLKCVFRDEMRIISVSPVIGYSDLVEKLSTEYGEDDLRIQYEDEEGDLITIRSQADVEEAFVFFGDAHRPSVKLLLTSLSTSSALQSSSGSVSSQTKRQSVSSSNIKHNQQDWPQDSSVSNSPKISPKQPTNKPPETSSGLSYSLLSRARDSEQYVIRWQSGGLIGEGGFGKVYLGMNTETGELLAVKQVPLTAESKQKVESLRREIALMQDLHHPNIVRYFGSEAKDGALNIFLEYQPGGSIASLLSKFHQLSERIIRSFTKQTLLGLEYLHSHGIAHRDIKGANLLVDLNGVVKLADFGASKQLADLKSYNEGCQTVTGSPYWMAPEVIQGNGGLKSYGRKADIWSLGAVVIEMATGKPPFHNLAPVTALFRIGSSSAIPEMPSNLSALGKDFLSKCFQRDATKRPTASELLQHPWITQLDQNPSPTISSTYDTHKLAFQHEDDETPHVHVIEGPTPGPMPKNPKGHLVPAVERREKPLATQSIGFQSSKNPKDLLYSLNTLDLDKPANSNGKSKRRSPRNDKADEESSSPRRKGGSDSSIVSNSNVSTLENMESEDEDGFGSILDFVTQKATN